MEITKITIIVEGTASDGRRLMDSREFAPPVFADEVIEASHQMIDGLASSDRALKEYRERHPELYEVLAERLPV